MTVCGQWGLTLAETLAFCMFTPNVQQWGCGRMFSRTSWQSWLIQTQPSGDHGDKEDNGDLIHCYCESVWTEGTSSVFFLEQLICRSAVLVIRGGGGHSAARQYMLFNCKTHAHFVVVSTLWAFSWSKFFQINIYIPQILNVCRLPDLSLGPGLWVFLFLQHSQLLNLSL